MFNYLVSENFMYCFHPSNRQLNGHEFEQAPGVGGGQGGLLCCSPWGHRESDSTERLNWTEYTEQQLLSVTYGISSCFILFRMFMCLFISCCAGSLAAFRLSLVAVGRGSSRLRCFSWRCFSRWGAQAPGVVVHGLSSP